MEASNANANDPFERQEQGMWISKNPTTGEYAYTIFDEGFSNFYACGFDYNNPPIPPNVVAWVHTQPFEIGEIKYPCYGPSESQIDMIIQADPNALDIYEYRGTPSTSDVKAAIYFKTESRV
jgi:hypothetical protein